jgi:intracellular septation protein
MKLLVDFLPLVLFFVAYKLQGIYAATGVIMAATVAQTAWLRWRGELETMHQVTLVLVLVFGALTLALQDERFIKWKPTVLYTALAVVLGAALWGWKKNLLRMMLGSQIALPDPVWARLTAGWVAYSLFMAGLNGWVAAFYSTDAWVSFKLWGYVFPLAFLVIQGVYIARHLEPETPKS